MTSQRFEAHDGAENSTDAAFVAQRASSAPLVPSVPEPAMEGRYRAHDPHAGADWATPTPPVTRDAHSVRARYGAIPNPVPAEPVTSRKRVPAALVVVAVCGLAGGTILGGVAGAAVSAGVFGSQQAQSSVVTVDGAVATDPSTIADVAATASASVVTVQVSGAQGSGTGSGVVVADGGYIVTNNHVVTLDGAEADAAVTVQTSDGLLLRATIVGTDPTVDLAVLRVDAALAPIAFADSSSVSVGDTAIAIGSPLGLSNSVTDGIVSAVDRGLSIASSSTDQGDDQSEGSSPFGFWNQDGAQAAEQSVAIPVIQTDASINPGNSGGALLNSAGQLMGVNVAIASLGSNGASGSIGIGFAIESSLVQRVVNEIIETGSATHGLLGASVSDVTDASIGVVGAQIAELSNGGAASAAGLQMGDVITAVDGTPVSNATDLTAQVRAEAAGTTVTLDIVRGSQEEQVDVTLGSL